MNESSLGRPATLNALDERSRLRHLDRTELDRLQLERFNRLLLDVLPRNKFYSAKIGTSLRLNSLDELRDLPFTTKEELSQQSEPDGWPVNLTFSLDRYVRYHQTSGTSGRPIKILDTAEDWRWWIDTWQYVLDSGQITSADRCLLAFSFGPFVGFWSAFESLIDRGVMAIPTGGMSTATRLEMIRTLRATVLLCTPSYALHLGQAAPDHSIAAEQLGVRAIIVAGEPGGSIPTVRERIQSIWNAEVIDHAGASEVGPWGVADDRRLGLHVVESEFIAEFLSMESDRMAGEAELAELVLTNLGRRGSPVIRYRTGDLVRPSWGHDRACRFVLVPGGVLGRRDDMVIIRGVNIFPSSIDEILRGFPEIDEYRIIAFRETDAMEQLRLEVEDRGTIRDGSPRPCRCDWACGSTCSL